MTRPYVRKVQSNTPREPTRRTFEREHECDRYTLDMRAQISRAEQLWIKRMGKERFDTPERMMAE